MKKLGFAIIGCGRISPKHIEGIINNYQDISLIAVCDIIPEKMDKAISFYNDYINTHEQLKEKIEKTEIKKYQNYKDLLKDEEIDV